MNEIVRQPLNWEDKDKNLANTYLNIANSLSMVRQWMKLNLDNVKNGGGIITLGDLQEAFKMLEKTINERLRSSISNKITIYFPYVNENKQYSNMKKLIRLTEGDLHRIVSKSINKVLKEQQADFEPLSDDNERKKLLSELMYRIVWDDMNAFEGIDENDINNMVEYFVNANAGKIYNMLLTMISKYMTSN